MTGNKRAFAILRNHGLRLDENWQRAVCSWRGWPAERNAATDEKIAAEQSKSSRAAPRSASTTSADRRQTGPENSASLRTYATAWKHS